jgi:transposase
VAAAQPSISSVPIESAEQQAGAMLLSVRELLVRQRTQLVNALRGHAAELGVVPPPGEKGSRELRAEIAAADDATVPAAAKQALALLSREADRIEMRRQAIDAVLMQPHRIRNSFPSPPCTKGAVHTRPSASAGERARILR